MEYKNGVLYYTKGKANQRLLNKVRYNFYVLDGVYADVTKKIQILYQLTHPRTREIVYLMEEYDPTSKKFDDIMGTVFYTLESNLIRKVCLDDFKELSFSAEVYEGVNGVEIDWQTAVPEEATMSQTYKWYEAIGLVD